MLTVPAAGNISEGIPSIFHREPGLIMATNFFELVKKDREELKRETYEDYISGRLEQLNRENEVQVTREQVIEAYPIDTFGLDTVVDFTLERVNKKRNRKDLERLSYVEFQAEVSKLMETNAFCKNRAETMRKVIRILKRELAN